MQLRGIRYAITRDRYAAVLLDLDGVITDTASLHAACWKQRFDEYLNNRATRRGEAFRAFDLWRTIGSMRMESPGPKVLATFSRPAISSFPRERPDDPPADI